MKGKFSIGELFKYVGKLDHKRMNPNIIYRIIKKEEYYLQEESEEYSVQYYVFNNRDNFQCIIDENEMEAINQIII